MACWCQKDAKTKERWRPNTVVTYRVFFGILNAHAMQSCLRVGRTSDGWGAWLTVLTSSCKVTSHWMELSAGYVLKISASFDAKQFAFRLFIHTDSYLTSAIRMTHIPTRHHIQIHKGIASLPYRTFHGISIANAMSEYPEPLQRNEVKSDVKRQAPLIAPPCMRMNACDSMFQNKTRNHRRSVQPTCIPCINADRKMVLAKM